MQSQPRGELKGGEGPRLPTATGRWEKSVIREPAAQPDQRPEPDEPVNPDGPHRWHRYVSILSRLVVMARVFLRHRRYGQFALWAFAGPLAFVITRFFLWLDTIVYPALRRMTLAEPVFIIGHPRSGTTFLQQQFHHTGKASMFRTWELMFPSLTQRRFFSPVISLLRQLGLEQLRGADTGHEVTLDGVEEDEAIFLHRLDTETMTFVCPWLLVDDDVADFWLHVGNMGTPVTRGTVRFYEDCLKRQLIHTGKPHVVAKCTPSVFRLPEIMRRFPDARIIYVFRDPEETIRSYLAMHERYVGSSLSPKEAQTYFQRKYDWGVSLYTTFEAVKHTVPEDQLLILPFTSLIEQPEETLKVVLEFSRIDHPGVTMGQSRRRRKKHRNPPLDNFGLSPEQIGTDLAFLRRRYNRRLRKRWTSL